MAKGGARTPGPGKKIGRPKLERTVDPGIAAKVLAKQKSEILWNEIVMTDVETMRMTRKTGPLRDTLTHLEDRAYGKTIQPVQLGNSGKGPAIFVLERIGKGGE